jgi:phosphonopyruvate decarboxylase
MESQALIGEFKRHGIGPYIEVPCSLLAPLIFELLNDPSCEVINPVNEAVAMGMASGAYLATRRIPMVLIQNSGFCNTLNCLTSLNQVYGIPVVYLISWRGEPGTKDAPEHDIMGGRLERILDAFDVPYRVLTEAAYANEIAAVVDLAKTRRSPSALLLRKGLLSGGSVVVSKPSFPMTKSMAVDIIINACGREACLVTTNGLISREVFNNLIEKQIDDQNPPFYMLGSMGHALALALGIGRALKDTRKVVVLDGDGGCLMHLGSMASVRGPGSSRLIHVVLDNGCYASTGGQSTVSGGVDFCQVAMGCGYKNSRRFEDDAALKKGFPALLTEPGPIFVHVLINRIEGKGRCRISDQYSCSQIRDRFMKRLDILPSS